MVVSNTTSETTIFEHVLPAGATSQDLDSYDLRVIGTVVNNTGSGQTYRLRMYVNGTVVYNSTTPGGGSAIATSTAARWWYLDGSWLRKSATTLDFMGLHTVGSINSTGVGLTSLGSSVALAFSPFGALSAACDWANPVTNKLTIELSAGSTNYYANLNWRVKP
jgi:hypothetical protein